MSIGNLKKNIKIFKKTKYSDNNIRKKSFQLQKWVVTSLYRHVFERSCQGADSADFINEYKAI